LSQWNKYILRGKSQNKAMKKLKSRKHLCVIVSSAQTMLPMITRSTIQTHPDIPKTKTGVTV
jgi:hypothetical protein